MQYIRPLLSTQVHQKVPFNSEQVQLADAGVAKTAANSVAAAKIYKSLSLLMGSSGFVALRPHDGLAMECGSLYARYCRLHHPKG